MDATSKTRMGLPIDEQLNVPPFQDVKVQCCLRLRKRGEGPIRIFFEGNIGVGKSTILKLLNSHPQLHQLSFTLLLPHFSSCVCIFPDIISKSFYFTPKNNVLRILLGVVA